MGMGMRMQNVKINTINVVNGGENERGRENERVRP
jgi:hypothetical protein